MQSVNVIISIKISHGILPKLSPHNCDVLEDAGKDVPTTRNTGPCTFTTG